jgi:hypothetical protein
MSQMEQIEKTPEVDLIDRIANVLPIEVRAEYYRELRHCRSLPENDEMLRILRIMQFLTLLMVEIPSRINIERERLEPLFVSGVNKVQEGLNSAMEFQKDLDSRLVRLPNQIAEGINPEAIVAGINESLKQQFLNSTIPETARALSLVADDMESTLGEFSYRARLLNGSFSKTIETTEKSIATMEKSVTKASEIARQTIENLSLKYRRENLLLRVAWMVLALTIGFCVGIKYEDWRNRPPVKSEIVAPIVAPAPKPAPHIKKRS